MQHNTPHSNGCYVNSEQSTSLYNIQRVDCIPNIYQMYYYCLSDPGTGWVFGIPLGKVIANDLELRRRRPSIMRERRESLDLPSPNRQSRYGPMVQFLREMT